VSDFGSRIGPAPAPASHVVSPKKISGVRRAAGDGTRRRPCEIRGSPSGGSLLGNGTVLCKKVSPQAGGLSPKSATEVTRN
jgi:hypothetical protein